MIRLTHKPDFDSLVHQLRRIPAWDDCKRRLACNPVCATQVEGPKFMQSYLQRGNNSRQPAVWLRTMAALCILMVTFMSAAQACHTHAEASSLRHGSHHQPPTEDHCAVCVAMHSALPASLHLAAAPTLRVEALAASASDSLRIFPWRFEMASRGPPAGQNEASSL